MRARGNSTRRRDAGGAAAVAVAALALLAGAGGPPDGIVGESSKVLVSTTGDHSELYKTVPITKRPGRGRRVVMSMGPAQLPSLQTGDRLRVTAELQVTTDCLVHSRECVGHPYLYSPHVRTRLVLAGSRHARGPAVPLSGRKGNRCRQPTPHREHHCMFVFRRGAYEVPETESLPCSPGSCFVNLVLGAHARAARHGDRLLLGANEPDGSVEQDRGRINAVRIRPPSDSVVPPIISQKETRVSTRERDRKLVTLGRHRRTVVYSQQLDDLKSGEQLAVSATMGTDLSNLGRDARITARLVLANAPDSPRPAVIARRIASTQGEIAEANGFNCTQPNDPCRTRKVGVLRIDGDAVNKAGFPVPLYVNLVVVAASRPPGQLHGHAVRVTDTGRLRVVRFPASLRG